METGPKRDSKPQEQNEMLTRLWKKVKGSHPVDVASRRQRRGKCVKDTSGQSQPEEEQQNDDGSSGSDSDSSSEGYYSLDEMITVPTRRQNGEAVAPPDAPRVDLKFLARTHFPEFDLESIPDGETTESSDDESITQKKAELYRTKEDQDVAVFMELVKRMNIKSLLHLLQGHVRTQNLPPSYVREYTQALSTKKDDKESTSEDAENAIQKKPLEKKKHFRWAEVRDEKVRAVVHEIESIKEYKFLWWTPEEMHAIRTELIDIVQFFKKRRPNYILSVEVVAKQTESQSVIEENMKKLTEDSFPRGLETHIVKLLSDHRRNTIQAVLEEQKECRECNDNAETTMHCLHEQSLAYSRMSAKFAACMAKCDEIDALKANMSRWYGSAQAANV